MSAFLRTAIELRYILLFIAAMTTGVCVAVAISTARERRYGQRLLVANMRAGYGPAAMWPLPAPDAPDADFLAWSTQALDIANPTPIHDELAVEQLRAELDNWGVA